MKTSPSTSCYFSTKSRLQYFCIALAMFAALLLGVRSASAQQTSTSVTTGGTLEFTNPATWLSGGVPTNDPSGGLTLIMQPAGFTTYTSATNLVINSLVLNGNQSYFQQQGSSGTHTFTFDGSSPSILLNNGANGATLGGQNGATLNLVLNQVTTIGGAGSGGFSLKQLLSGPGGLICQTTNSFITLNGASTFSNGVSLLAGGLDLNNAKALGDGSSKFTIGDGTYLRSSTAATTIANTNRVSINGNFTVAGANSFSLQNGAADLGAAAGTTRTISVTNSAITLTLGPVANGTTGNSLAKAGVGVLTLNGTNTYTGTTTLSGGTLNILSSSTGGGSLSTADGTTLGITMPGATNSLTVSSLTMGSATAGNTINFNFGSVNPTTNMVTDAGALTVNGTVTVNGTGTGLRGPAPVVLVAYSSLAGSGSFVTGTLPSVAGYTAVLTNDTVNKKLEYVLIPIPPIKWAVGSGNWDTTTANWTNYLNGGALTNYVEYARVLFDDTTSGTSPIFVNLTASHTPGAITNNSTKNYIFTNSAIAGSAYLVKSGTSTLTFSNANTYTGGTILNSGEIDFSNTNSFGAGTINVNGGTLKFIGGGTVTNALSIAGTCSLGGSAAEVWNGAVNLNGAVQTITNVTFNQFGGIVSNGGMRLEKPTGFQYGFWLVNTANTYAGGTFLDGPQLDISSVAVLGTGPLEIVSSSWVVLEAANLELSGKLKIDDGANLSLDTGANSSTFTNAWACGPLGTAALTKLGAGALTLTAVNTNSGSTTISAGTLALTGTAGLPNTSLISVAGGANFNVAGLSSTFSLGGSQTLSNNASATGIIIGSLNTGSGTVSVSYTNGTPSLAVTNGTLTLSSGTVFKITNSGPALAVGSYKIISKGAGGVVAGTLPAVSVSGLAVNTSASLANISSELWLQVQTITTNTLTTSVSPSTYGQNVTLTATITPAPATVGETITFLDGATTIGTGTNNAGGVATFATSALTVGSHSITAVYPGDASNLGSTNTPALSQTVNSAPLIITANNASKTRDGVAFTGGNGVTYAGFVNGQTNTILGGTLSYSGTSQGATNVGSYAIVPSGLTSTNYAISYANGTLTINQAGTSVGASSTNNPSGYRDSVAFVATLPADATGSVVFSSTNSSFSTNTVGGASTMSLSITNLPRGTNLITVAYLGDTNYLGSTTTLNQIVTNHPPVANINSYTLNGLSTWKIKVSDLLTNASDVDGDTLSLMNVASSTNGVTLDTNAVPGYVLYANTNLVDDQFTYTVADGFGGTNSATITLSIGSANDIGGQVNSFTVTGGTASMNFAGIPGYKYNVQVSTNMTDWSTIWTTNAPTGGVFQFDDASAPEPDAYYRLMWNGN